MKRIIDVMKRETGLSTSEATIVSGILALLLIGWLGQSLLPTGATHDVQSTARVMAILDTLLSQERSVAAPPRSAAAEPADSTAPTDTASQSRRTVISMVRINSASKAALETLPGVGPAMADRIIEERNRRPFQSIDELSRVKGIGPKKLEKMRPFIIVP